MLGTLVFLLIVIILIGGLVFFFCSPQFAPLEEREYLQRQKHVQLIQKMSTFNSNTP